MTDYVIGLLHTGSSGDGEAGTFAYLATKMLAAAKSVLGEDGITIMKDGDTDGHYANDDIDKLSEDASTLASSGVKLIVAAGGPQSAIAAMEAVAEEEPDSSKRKAIVFTTVADPVGLGLVDSLLQPGRNLTGMAGQTSENDAVRLKLLHAFLSSFGKVPDNSKVGVLINPNRKGNPKQYKTLKRVAKRLKLDLVPKRVSGKEKIDNAFKFFRKKECIGAVVMADSFFNNNRDTVVAAAKGDARNPSIHTIYQWRQFVESKGLISYGPTIQEAYEVAGRYAAQICLGDNPGEIPCLVPTKFELVVNSDTANDSGLDVAKMPDHLNHDTLGRIDVVKYPPTP